MWQKLGEWSLTVVAARSSTMPKARFTLSDVAAMSREVLERCGDWRVAQVYDGDGRSFVFKLQQSGEAGKRLLLLESGTKFLVTKYDAREGGGDMPSGLCSKLRSALKGKRLSDVRALGRDRVVLFRFGAGMTSCHVVLELYAAGNVVLCDHDFVVRGALRANTFGDGAELEVGAPYPVASAAAGVGQAPAADPLAGTPAAAGASLLAFLLELREKRTARVAATLDDDGRKKKGKKGGRKEPTLQQLLLDYGSGVGKFGADVVEHCLAVAGLDGGGAVAGFAEADADALAAACGRAPAVFAAVASGASAAPRLIRKAGGGFESFAPAAFAQHASREVVPFDSFCAAVDEYGRETAEAKLGKASADATAAISRRVDKIRVDQAERLAKLTDDQGRRERDAAALERSADAVDKVLAVLRNALASGLRWEEIDDYVKDEQEKGSPLALLVHDVDYERKRVTVALPRDDDASDSDDEEDDASSLVVVDLEASARGSARELWAAAKKARAKAEKTATASAAVVAAAEKQSEAKLKARLWQQEHSGKLRKQRDATPWFCRYAYFASSEGYLCVCGRDKHQTETLLFGDLAILRPGDAVVCCDAAGAPPCVVRSRPDRPGLSPLALHEAGCFVACRSSAWAKRDRAPAWWVWGTDVKKCGARGAVTVVDALGDFAVARSATKTYLPPTQLELSFGLLFKLDDDASRDRHADELALRVPEADLVAPPEAAADDAEPEPEPEAEPEEPEPEPEEPETVEPEPEPEEPEEEPEEAAPEEEDEPEPEEVSTSKKLSAREKKLVKKFGGDVVAMRRAEQARKAKEARSAARAGSAPAAEPEPAPPAAPAWGVPKPKAHGKKGRKGKKGRRDESSGDDSDGPRVPLSKRAVPTIAKKSKARAAEPEPEPAPAEPEPAAPPAAPSAAALVDGTAADAVARLGPLAQTAWANCVAAVDGLAPETMAFELGRLARLNDAVASEALALFLEADGEEASRRAAALDQARARAKRGGVDFDAARDAPQAPRNLPALLGGIAKRVASGKARPGAASGGPTEDRAVPADDGALLRTFTGAPKDGDALAWALPVCAPTAAARHYAHALKLQPGTQKKGKAAKDALEILARSCDDADRRDLVKAVDVNECILAFVSSTKITHVVANQLKQARKHDDKMARKLKRKEER